MCTPYVRTNIHTDVLYHTACVLQCNRESFRSDTFLDIPLAIKPFGMDTALKSMVGPADRPCDCHSSLEW